MFDLEKYRRLAGERPTIYMNSFDGRPPLPNETNLLGALHEALDEIERLRKDAERWRYWRNYWPALCRMEVARFARLDLRTVYVQSPADMDKVTDAAMAPRAEGE